MNLYTVVEGTYVLASINHPNGTIMEYRTIDHPIIFTDLDLDVTYDDYTDMYYAETTERPGFFGEDVQRIGIPSEGVIVVKV